VEDLAFTHWKNNYPWWVLNPDLVPDKVTVWWRTLINIHPWWFPGSHALQCVFNVCDLKGEGKKRLH